MDEDRLITREEVAVMLGVSLDTVRRRVPGIKVGRSVRYSKAAVVAWATAQTVDPTKKREVQQ